MNSKVTTPQGVDVTIAPATTLSGLLEIAINDVEVCEHSPDHYALDMFAWVRRDWDLHIGDFCSVCMAGSVLAQRYGVVDIDDLVFEDDRRDLPPWVYAINRMRTGSCVSAAKLLEPLAAMSEEQLGALADCEDAINIEYIAAGHAPWRVYRECVELLKGVGL